MGTEEAALVWMESLCRNFQADPKSASEALMAFRDNPSAMSASKHIIQRSSIPMAQFHAACCLQASMLSKWERLAQQEKDGLRALLWQMLQPEMRWERFVKAQLIQTLSVSWKRGWAEEKKEAKLGLFRVLHDLAKAPSHKLVVSEFALGLIREFTSTKCSSVALPRELHRKAHSAFDSLGLNETLGLAMELLSGVSSVVGGEESMETTSTVVQLCAEVLSWEFVPLEPWQIPSAQQLVSPGIRWREYLVRPDILEAVFRVYDKVRSSAMGTSLPHSMRQLLLQFSSISGDIFDGPTQKCAYGGFLVEGVAKVLAAPLTVQNKGKGVTEWQFAEAQASEALGMTSIALRLIGNMGLKQLASLGSFQSLIGQLRSLTFKVLTESTKAAQEQEDLADCWAMECFDLLLEAWVLLVDDREMKEGGSPELVAAMVEVAYPIFEQYVGNRLAISRTEAAAGVGEEEQNEEEEIGSADLNEQLCSASCLGRLAPSKALKALTAHLRQLSRGVVEMVEAAKAQGAPGLPPHAEGLLEEVRVLVLLCGHLVADEDEGETPLIPEALLEGLRLDSDVVIALSEMVAFLGQMLEAELKQLVAVSQQHLQLLSPYLSEALLWFFRRWAHTYLMPNLTFYGDGALPSSLIDTFGMANPPPRLAGSNGSTQSPQASSLANHSMCNMLNAVQLTEAIFSACWTFLCFWPSEHSLCDAALEVLGILCSSPRASSTVALEVWWKAVHAHAMPSPYVAGRSESSEGFKRLQLPQRIALARWLAQGAIDGGGEIGQVQHRFNEVVRPIQERLVQLLGAIRAMPARDRCLPQVEAEIGLCSALYRGVAQVESTQHINLLSAFLQPSYDGLVELYSISVGWGGVAPYELLQLFRDIAEVQLTFMSAPAATLLYKSCGQVLQIYSMHHKGRREAAPMAEEESQLEILCVLQLLSHMVTKDLTNFGDGPQPNAPPEAISADVVFFGLSQVLPLITESLLKFPALAGQYFSLVAYMVEIHPAKLASLDPALFRQVLQSLVYGCAGDDSAIARKSLQAVAELAVFHLKSNGGLMVQLQQEPGILASIQRTLFEMVVASTCIWDRLDACALALLPLIMVEKAAFEALAIKMLEKQPQEYRARWGAAFAALVSDIGVTATINRAAKNSFKNKLKEFVSLVRQVTKGNDKVSDVA
ncbi:unnamed protein product [Chrysoparadoxa australica]